MKAYRATALTVLACLSGVSVAACSGGISSLAQSAPASSPASSPAASAAAATSAATAAGSGAPAVTSSGSAGAAASGAASTITVGGGIGTFPVPPGASVIENTDDNGNIDVTFTGVTASESTTFYTASLPSYGYTITEDDAASGGTYTGTTIKFTGHGYNGNIGGLSGTGTVGGISLGTGTTGGVTGITFIPQ